MSVRSQTVFRLVCFGLIAALFSSSLTPYALSSTRTAKSPPTDAPTTTPPQPFLLHSPRYSDELLAAALTVTSKVIAFFHAPSVPPGLEGSRIPNRTEGIYTAISSALALNAPASPVAPAAPPQPTSVVDFDFDNDGKADIGRWHGANTEFKVKNSNGGSYSIFTLGSSSAVIAPGDFNGDGKTDAAVFSSGTWTYKTSTTASAQTITWGMAGDVPVAGDYDGDGTTDAAIYRPSTTTWWIQKSGGGTTNTSFGSSGDVVAPGDYDGDGKNDLAIFRPSTGDWHVTGSTSGYYSFHWGIGIDTPAPADYDGDGKTDPAVFRPSTGVWYAYRSGLNNGSYYTQTWGNFGDQPVPGDYDGDNKADFAIWRPTTGMWYTVKSSDSSYTYQTLGVPGDRAVPSAYLKQVGGEVAGDALAAARLVPRNATGSTNLYSQNFAWGTSLVTLPGRAGLDAGLGISYNSLVWTKVGSSIVFDPDASNASPGFRFGFPVIEPVYYDSGMDLWAYIMITPAGERIQFRQTAVTNVYETAESSYTQLVTLNAEHPNDPVEDLNIKVTGTDGTQMTYAWNSGAYRCTQIKDRNGNYITNAYSSDGRLDTVTDTLGRVLTVNYDTTTGYPTTVTQTWRGTNGSGSPITHTWATLSYTTKTVDTDFSGLTVIGPPDDTVVSVLDKITYADGSSTKFEYNGYLQVKKISSLAADSASHVLNYTSTNLASPASSQTDCPRFTHTYTWAENFNLSGGTPQEVDVENLAPASSSFTGPNGSESTSLVKVTMAGHPDGLYSRIHFGPSGWKEGLTLATEDCVSSGCTGTDRKRWTWSDWTQDNTSLSYNLNPRVKESRVGDPSNTKKTKIYYYEPTTGSFPFGLPETVEIYDTTLSTVLKTQTTTYNLSSNYTDRRIIGLPSETKLFEGTTSGTLMSKVTFSYDDNGYVGSGQSVTPTQHDTAYGTSFAYRGNLTKTKRWDVNSPTNDSLAVFSSVVFNTAGSPISTTDPRGRVSTVSYTDVWNSSGNPATYAYPTTMTDPGGFSSTIEYRYDIGANTWARSPTPSGSGNTNGKTTSRTYSDTTGRIIKETIDNTGAYTEYEYANTGNAITTYTTIVDGNNNGADATDEVATETQFDGAGRVRRSRTENPGSSGGYTGTLVEYDVLGRVKRETVPTEINSSWNPAGDDYRGMSGSDYIWLWNSKEYDWKGRVTRTIPSDSTGSDGKDTLMEYAGCGCAGGQVTTIKGPVTSAIDVSGTLQTTKRRWQKIYEDILGRTYKTEVWDLDGGGSTPYSTTKTTFNGRDQATAIVQYAGSDSSSTHQDTTLSYDGHGRLSTKHLPEYDTSTVTAWTYYADDTVATVTDPRGASVTYKYGNADDSGSSEYRPLLTKILYSSPGSAIPDPTDVIFTYDSAGNRTFMSDDSGNLTYTFDELSRLKSETKTFSDTLSEAPSGGYVLSYTYHLAGGLKSITDPFDRVIKYGADKTGRVTIVGNATSSTAYASSVAHRSFGAIKSMALSAADPVNVSLTYDNRLRPSTYEADSAANTSEIQKASYSYHNDNALNTLDGQAAAPFDQQNKYDFAGRLKENVAGPSSQTMAYDAFGNLTDRTTAAYSFGDEFWAEYTNNRKTNGSRNTSYDAAGNTIGSSALSTWDATSWTFDAPGRQQKWQEQGPYGNFTKKGGQSTFDGDGRAVKTSQLQSDKSGGVWGSWYTVTSSYYIYSSVTGQKVVELASNGGWHRTHIYLAKANIADERSTGVQFNVTDPLSSSTRETNGEGVIPTDEALTRNELGALGTTIPLTELSSMPEPNYSKGGWIGSAEDRCTIDGGPLVGREQCARIFQALGGTIFSGHIISEIRQEIDGRMEVTDVDELPLDPVGNVVADDNHCALMVGILQLAVDENLKILGGASKMTDHSALNQLVKNIDTTFNDFFIGKYIKKAYGLPPAGSVSSSSTTVTGPPAPYNGQGGFKIDYQDGESDQTHHFARFFRAGIRTENIKAAAFTMVFDAFNTKDQALSAVAYSLGASLNAKQIGTTPERIDMGERSPITVQAPVYESAATRLERIRRIANAVSSAICE